MLQSNPINLIVADYVPVTASFTMTRDTLPFSEYDVCLLITGEKERVNIDMFQLFPNPSINAITLEVPPDTRNHIKLLNDKGQILSSFDLITTKFQLDISGYPAGMYLLLLKNEYSVQTKWFVKIQ
jgi:hypothetical protein